MSEVKSFRAMLGAPPVDADPKSSILIIIDAQNEYASGLLKTYDVSSTRANISKLLQTYRTQAPKHIVHITHQTPAGAPVFTPDTALAQPFDEVTPKPDEKHIWKQQPGAFTGTDLDAHLKSLGDAAKTVVLCGYMAHVCVSTTARQAAERGLQVVVAREAVGDRDIPGAQASAVVENALRELSDAFAEVQSVQQIAAH
ncbi:MAG: hypothetical protein Q9159_001907 [Coniocarpon cinnabarinum]